jgi:putative tricarboxylic transport membrane protein
MGDLVSNLALGFGVALSFQNIALCFLGCMVGNADRGPAGRRSDRHHRDAPADHLRARPVGALIMLAGIYYGAQYGGSTTAILVNIPGEATSVVTTLDGFQMARQGRAGVALGIAAIGPSSPARSRPSPSRRSARP